MLLRNNRESHFYFSNVRISTSIRSTYIRMKLLPHLAYHLSPFVISIFLPYLYVHTIFSRCYCCWLLFFSSCFFFSFSIYFCLAFCDVAFVCFFVLLVISSQNIDTTTLHVPHFDGAVIISMLGVDVVSCSSLTELFMTLSLFSHSSSPPSLSPSLSSAKLFSHVLEPMAKHDCKISKTHQYCM